MSAAAAHMKGKLTVTVIEAKELKDTEILGKMDPYVKMRVGNENHKTSVKNNAGRAATWNESFIFNLEGKEDTLHLEVYDKELISDDKVGRVDIPLHKLVSATGPIWYQLVDHNNFKKIAGQVALSVEFKGTGAPSTAATAAAPSKTQAAPVAQAPVAAAAAAAAAPQVAYAQPQMVYAAPQMMAQPMVQPGQQVVYAQQPQMVMQQPQTQLVRGTDGKLYAIAAAAPQPQVVYVQAPAATMQVQQPRYM